MQYLTILELCLICDTCVANLGKLKLPIIFKKKKIIIIKLDKLAPMSRNNVKNEPSGRQSVFWYFESLIPIPCGASILWYLPRSNIYTKYLLGYCYTFIIWCLISHFLTPGVPSFLPLSLRIFIFHLRLRAFARRRDPLFRLAEPLAQREVAERPSQEVKVGRAARRVQLVFDPRSFRICGFTTLHRWWNGKDKSEINQPFVLVAVRFCQ